MAITKAAKVMDARRDSEVPEAKMGSRHIFAGDDVNDTLVCQSCTACPYCSDSCGNPSCVSCDRKLNEMERLSAGPCGRDCARGFTMCEIKRHNTIDSAWLLVGETVYDATTYMKQHPGGERSILKKSGGVVDCAQDFKFHSKKGQKLWGKYIVGKVVKCPGPAIDHEEKQWWMFWS